jgi:TPR repeat protein
VRYWKSAAKAQQPVALYKLGYHLYKGDLATLGRNVEDAVIWLTRFQRCASDRLVRSRTFQLLS